ncbi:MAG: hypothetical protein WDN25_05575 [Acetobacteraceae bacterium]
MRAFAVVLVSWLALTASPAKAEKLRFVVGGAVNLSWSLDSDPQPTLTGSGFWSIGISNVRWLDFNLNDSAGFQFYDASQEGGFDIFPSAALQELGLPFSFSPTGDVVWTGTLDAPHFSRGAWRFTDYFEPSLSYTLQVWNPRTEQEPALPPLNEIPEPGTWIMLVTGVFLQGTMLRWRSA